MSTYFTYSILQYKHNLVLGEVLNVGILFHFPLESRFEFVKGDGYRAKAIYPDFDNFLFNAYIRNITNRIKKHVTIFNTQIDKSDFAQYIHQKILAEDAAGLIFKTPVQVQFQYDTLQNVVDEYSKLLLPGINTDKPTVVKHNDQYIIKTFQGYFQDRFKDIEKKIIRNKNIKTKHFDIKFDWSFERGVQYLIKPLSFDLTDEGSIQTKAAVAFSHLLELKEYAKSTKSTFDLLISQPQNEDYKREYENAIDLVDSIKACNLITQDKWESHTQNIYNLLHEN